MSRILPFALAILAAAACQSFGDATVADDEEPMADAGTSTTGDGGDPPPGVELDGGPDVVPPRACRVPFGDDFERAMLTGGGWTSYPTGLRPGLAMDLVNDIAAGGSTSLRVVTDDDRDGGTSSYFVKKMDDGPLGAPCPIQVALDLRRGATSFGEHDFITFVSIELTNSTAILLTLHKDGFRVSEQEGAGKRTESAELALPAQGLFTPIVLRYDAAATPPVVIVTVGNDKPVIYPTQIPKLGTPIRVHVGAAYATLGTAATLHIDNLRIE